MDSEFIPCDTCGVRSYMFVFLRSGGELSLCGHHGIEATPKLRDMGAIILDNRGEILPARTPVEA